MAPLVILEDRPVKGRTARIVVEALKFLVRNSLVLVRGGGLLLAWLG